MRAARVIASLQLKPVLVILGLPSMPEPNNECLLSIIIDFQAVPKCVDDKHTGTENIISVGQAYESISRQRKMWHQCPSKILPSQCYSRPQKRLAHKSYPNLFQTTCTKYNRKQLQGWASLRKKFGYRSLVVVCAPPPHILNSSIVIGDTGRDWNVEPQTNPPRTWGFKDGGGLRERQ